MIAEVAGFEDPAAYTAEFFMVEETGVGDDFPFSGEKLSVVLAVYRYDSFDDAAELVGAHSAL